MEQETTMQQEKCRSQAEKSNQLSPLTDDISLSCNLEAYQQKDIEKPTCPSNNETTVLTETSSQNQDVAFGGYTAQPLHDANYGCAGSYMYPYERINIPASAKG